MSAEENKEEEKRVPSKVPVHGKIKIESRMNTMDIKVLELEVAKEDSVEFLAMKVKKLLNDTLDDSDRVHFKYFQSNQSMGKTLEKLVMDDMRLAVCCFMGGCDVGADFVKLYAKPDVDTPEGTAIDSDDCVLLGFWSSTLNAASRAQRRNTLRYM